MAVEANGMALEFVDAKKQNFKNILMAVQQNPRAIEFANFYVLTDEQKNTICSEAVERNGMVINIIRNKLGYYAAEHCRGAIMENSKAYELIDLTQLPDSERQALKHLNQKMIHGKQQNM
jgi:hypothetical protein